jgi:hypothetical protein
MSDETNNTMGPVLPADDEAKAVSNIISSRIYTLYKQTVVNWDIYKGFS